MIAQRLHQLHEEIPQGVTLVAVSKYHPVEDVREAYEAGQRVFGESHATEMVAKAQALPADIEWHFIGHLQTNKVRLILPYVGLIQSVDSLHLLDEIEHRASLLGRTVPCLLQVHVAQEETKFGFLPDELLSLFHDDTLSTFPHVLVRGLMCMASNTDDEERVRQDFATAHDLFVHLFPHAEADHAILSMGMSGDWPLAVAQGSNMVRIGTTLFGSR